MDRVTSYPMPWHELPKKGLSRFLLDTRLAEDALHFHVSSVEGGQRSHAPHEHEGVEAVYVLAGEATLEFSDEQVRLTAGESVVFDPRRLHGLVNTGATANRYMVIIRPA